MMKKKGIMLFVAALLLVAVAAGVVFLIKGCGKNTMQQPSVENAASPAAPQNAAEETPEKEDNAVSQSGVELPELEIQEAEDEPAQQLEESPQGVDVHTQESGGQQEPEQATETPVPEDDGIRITDDGAIELPEVP